MSYFTKKTDTNPKNLLFFLTKPLLKAPQKSFFSLTKESNAETANIQTLYVTQSAAVHNISTIFVFRSLLSASCTRGIFYTFSMSQSRTCFYLSVINFIFRQVREVAEGRQLLLRHFCWIKVISL